MALDEKTIAMLKRLKEKVDLEEFLISEGFYNDKSSDWGNSKVYKNGTYAVSVSFDKGQWIGYDLKGNLTGPKSSGDIVQIYRELYGKSFREALFELHHRYSSRNVHEVQTHKEKNTETVVTPKDKPRKWKKIEEDLAGFKLVTEYWYLEVQRGITRETLNSKRFAGKIYHANCNVMFPHAYKTCGSWVPCGYEIKRKNYSRFSSGGVRGLWFSNVEPDDHTIVFCESAIDCMSWHIVNDSPSGVAYISVAGRISNAQLELIELVLVAARDHKPPTKIILAFDNDTAGWEFIRQVKDILPEFSKSVDIPPKGYKDWNEYLMDKKK